MTCNKHTMYTIMHVLGNWHVNLRCQQGNIDKQNPERGKRTVKQIRLWSTTSFKSKFDLLKVCSRVFLNWDWAEWPLTINLQTAWLHYAYLRLQVPWVLVSSLITTNNWNATWNCIVILVMSFHFLLYSW